MATKMTKTDVLFISIVPAGANKRQVIFKAAGLADEARVFDRAIDIRKADDERQVIYGIAYPVGDAKNTDTQGDFADAAEVAAMAYAFMAKGRTAWGVDRDHSYRALEAAHVAESWIVRKGDPIFGAAEDEGAWAVGIKIIDKALYDEFKKTGYHGLSIAGTCERAEVAEKTAGDANEGWLAKIFRLLRKEETVDELKKAIEELAKSIKTIDEKVGKLEKSDASPAPAEPDLAKRIAELDKQVKDLTAKLDKAEADPPTEGEAPDVTKQVADLTKTVGELTAKVEKLAKAKPGSAQGDPNPKTEKAGDQKSLGLL